MFKPNPTFIRVNPDFKRHLDSKDPVSKPKRATIKDRSDFNDISLTPTKPRTV